MNSDEHFNPNNASANNPTGRRIRVRSLRQSSIDQQQEARLPSIPSDDNDWVSPFTLPPLPSLKRNRGNPDPAPEDRAHDRSGSSAYYAAAWGSPYATPSPHQSPANHSARKHSLDIEASSPIAIRKSAVPRSLRARKLSLPYEDSISPFSVRPSADDATDPQAQRRVWLSESEESDGDIEKTRTPTRDSSTDRLPSSARSHRLQESLETITPETFSGTSSARVKFSLQPDHTMAETEIEPVSQPAVENDSPQKPLPDLPSREEPVDKVEPLSQSRPAIVPLQSFQRPKKKVPWKGKSCIIALPLTDREQAGLPPLLTKEEIRARLQNFIDQGYPVHGFSVGEWGSVFDGGASRPPFPDAADMDLDRKTAGVSVHVPNQAEWDAWVEHLKEEKLRALGVTISAPEPPPSTSSPFSSAMSRVSSTFPSTMAASPPMPTLSAASSQRMVHSPFSPPLSNPSLSNFNASSARATPIAGMQRPMHGYNQSMALPSAYQRMGSPLDYLTQGGAFGQGGRSPLEQARRPFSPGHVQNMQSMGQILSPLGGGPPDFGRYTSSNPQIEHIRRQQELLAQQQRSVQEQIARHNVHQRQMSMFPMHTTSVEQQLPRTPVVQSPPEQNPEIMHPTPRSHRHNLSEALEQGAIESIRQASEKMQQNVEETTQDKTEESANKDVPPEEDNAPDVSTMEDELPILKRPETIKEADDKEEIETNPSIAGTPLLMEDKNPFANFKPLQPAGTSAQGHSTKSSLAGKPGHAAQTSLSKLNVQAKEFNPSGMFSGSTFNFGQKPAAPVLDSTTVPALPWKPTHKVNVSSLSKLNVTAKEFTPSFLKQDTPQKSIFGSSVQSSVGLDSIAGTPDQSAFDPRSSTFSFTSATFNVEAPEFKPSHNFDSSISFTPEKAQDFKSSIFGDVVIENPSKVMRRGNTKALPIVRPPSQQGKTPEPEIEDSEDSNRLRRADDRPKRARTADADGDDEPLFATNAPFTSLADDSKTPEAAESTEQVSVANEPKDKAEGELSEPVMPDAPEASDSPAHKSPAEAQDAPISPKPVEHITETETTQPAVPSETVAEDEAPVPSKPKRESIRQGKDILAAALSEAVAKNAVSAKNKKSSHTPAVSNTADIEQDIQKAGEKESEKAIEVQHAPATTEKEAEEDKPYEQASAKAPIDTTAPISLGANVPAFQPAPPEAPAAKPALSAAAEPFVFKPVATEFVPQPAAKPVEQPKSQPQATKPKKTTGLMASRFASSPPPEPNSESVRQPSLPSSPPVQGQQPQSSPRLPAEDTLPASTFKSVETPERAPESTASKQLLSSSPRVVKEEERTSPIPMVDEERPQSESLEKGDLSFEEINAVMQQFEDDPDLGIIREDTPVRSTPLVDMRLPQNFRSDAPSPSPRRLDQPFVGREQSRYSGLGFELSGVHQLNYGSRSVSDWNADIDLSPGQQDKLEARARFFDDHANDLVDNILENRLAPLERMLHAIHETMAAVADGPKRRGRTSTSTLQKDSDADDEDDYDAYEGYAHYRSKSPQKRNTGRREERLKNMIAEALASHQAEVVQQPSIDMQAIQDTLSELRAATQQQKEPEQAISSALDQKLSELRDLAQQQSQPTSEIFAMRATLDELRELSVAKSAEPSLDQTGLQQMLEELLHHAKRPEPEQKGEQPDLKAVLTEVIDAHPRLQAPAKKDDPEVSEKLQLKIEGLESMLKVAEKRADGEAALRREAEDEIEILSRNLKEAQDSVNTHREASVEAKKSLESFLKEKQSYHEITPELQNLRLKNTELEKTLEEYRLSHDKWREDVREERAKNQDLLRTLQEVQDQYEDRLESRQMLREQVDRVQQRMTKVMEDVKHDQAEWRKREHDLASKNQLLQSALDHETNRRAKVELDVDKISREHRDSLHFKVKHENAQDEISRLAGIIVGLQAENKAHQDAVYQAQRELAAAKEDNEATIASTTADLERELNLTRKSLRDVQDDADAQTARLQARLRSAETDLEEDKSKHKETLETAFEAHNQTVREVNEKHESELEAQATTYENKLSDLRDRHTRALHNSSDDRHRLEQHLNEKLALRDDQIKHLTGKVTDLEERLEVTRTAARAAVEAASAKGGNLPTPASSVVASPPHRPSISASMPLAKGSELPEKISPQALRESIMVLQDQLQAREQEIEKLESELAAIDKDAPAKVKERDTEITMLRELLDVRVDDLQELINTLEKPQYDRNAVKDAAIRLKTQIRMEQQLKERAISGATLASNLPSSIASGLTNLASSPRAMVAAAAWGNWRKVRDTSVNAVSDLASNMGSQTPSRSSSTSSTFLSGMLTPPPSMQPPQRTPNARARTQPKARPLAAAAGASAGSSRTARRSSTQGSVPEARPLRAFSSQPRTLAKRGSDSRPGSSGSLIRSLEPSSTKVEPTSTPLHLKTDSDFGDDVDDDASPLDGREKDFGMDESGSNDEQPLSPKLTMSSPQRRRLAAQHLESQLEDDETVQVLEESDF